MHTSNTDQQDKIDALMVFLRQANPTGATAAKALVHRLRRASHTIDRQIRRELAPYGIELWELEILAALRRADGPRFQLTSGALLDETSLTSGAITKRVAHLEAKGWVARAIDPDDRRRVLVTLTDAGFTRAETVFGVLSQAEAALLAQVDSAVLNRMNDDLRVLLLMLEGVAMTPPPHD